MAYQDERPDVKYPIAVFLGETVEALTDILVWLQQNERETLNKVPENVLGKAKGRHLVLSKIAEDKVDFLKMPFTTLCYYAAREGISILDLTEPLEPQIKEILRAYQERLTSEGYTPADVEAKVLQSRMLIEAEVRRG